MFFAAALQHRKAVYIITPWEPKGTRIINSRFAGERSCNYTDRQ